MERIKSISFRFRQNMFLLAGVCLSLYFSYHMLYGVRSFSNLAMLQTEVQQQTDVLENVREERENLEVKVVRMRPETLSPDLVEERARAVLGYKKPEEIVVTGN